MSALDVTEVPPVQALVTTALAQDGALTFQLSAQELRRLMREFRAVVTAADLAIESLLQLAGPEPGPLPQHLKTMMNMGAGYARHCETTLAALFKACHDRRAGTAESYEKRAQRKKGSR